MADPSADRPGRATFIVLAIAVALAIPSALVTQKLSVAGSGDAQATTGWGAAAVVALIAAIVGLVALRFTRARGRSSLKIALVAMVLITLFLLIIVWQLYATTATHGVV